MVDQSRAPANLLRWRYKSFTDPKGCGPLKAKWEGPAGYRVSGEAVWTIFWTLLRHDAMETEDNCITKFQISKPQWCIATHWFRRTQIKNETPKAINAHLLVGAKFHAEFGVLIKQSRDALFVHVSSQEFLGTSRVSVRNKCSRLSVRN